MFALGYYGLFRVGELTESQHVIKAANVHIAQNKNKIMVILYSSKTHGQANWPQKVIITVDDNITKKLNFCPFAVMLNFINIRRKDVDLNEQLFIFRDGSLVKPRHASAVLKSALTSLGLDASLYGMHSLRIGRASDLLLKYNCTLDFVKRTGHWRSNVVCKYIRQ